MYGRCIKVDYRENSYEFKRVLCLRTILFVVVSEGYIMQRYFTLHH